MPRSLSSVARQAALAEQTGEAFIVLLKIEHPSIPAPLLFTSDSVNTIVGGDTYQAFPFDVVLADESEDAPGPVELRIDNIDRQITLAVRSIPPGTPPTVTLSVVLASSPGTVEAGPFTFDLNDVSWTATTVTGRLVFEPYLNEPYPGNAFTPDRYPALSYG